MVDFGEGKKPSSARTASLSLSEIVGQEELKRSLLAVAANDDLDGLLVRGEKGTAKSTAVRALTDLLPRQDVVEDCPYGCPPDVPAAQCEDCRERTDPPTAERPVPLVTLPLGATRERVVGTLSVGDALVGEYEFDPGLLARANRGILYVDEVNLLDDHLVDVVLDAAASGVNTVERDGVSVAHPAEFTLVGTMNPEEGDLRPQLRDRFAFQATVTACDDVDRRVSIIDRAIGRADSDVPEQPTDRSGETVGASGPSGGSDSEGSDTIEDCRVTLRQARDRLPEVELSTEFAREIATLCRDAGVEGHRGDIATARGARTFAALDGRSTVIEPDVRRAAELALPHRLRSRPFEDAPDPGELIDEHFDGADGDGDRTDGTDPGGDHSDDRTESSDGADDPEHDDAGAPDPSGSEAGDEADGAADGEMDDEAGENGGPENGVSARNRGGDRGTDDVGAGASDDGRASGDDRTSSGDRPWGEDDSPPERTNGTDERRSAAGRSDVDRSTAGRADGDRGTIGRRDADDRDDGTDGTPIVPGQSRADVGAGRAPELAAPDAVDGGRAGDGTRSRTEPHVDGEGARIRSRRADSPRRIDVAASVRAASSRGASSVESRDLRQSVRQRDSSALVVFVVDASASMLPAMRDAKGTVLELLKDAYQERDEVAFVAFAGDEATVLLPPTNSVTLAARHLKELPTGDRTPLPAGLRTAGDVLDRADPAAGVVVLVTDGRANVADGSPVRETRDAARRLRELGPHVVVVDAGENDRSGLTGLVAEETGGERVPLSALSADRVDAAVDAARDR